VRQRKLPLCRGEAQASPECGGWRHRDESGSLRCRSPDMNLHDDLRDARATLHIGYPWWLRRLLLKNVVAITLGRRIYVRGAIDDRVIRHELAHVRQVNRLGLTVFLARYLYEFVRNLIRERSLDRAYRSISFEREAYEAETLV
jgi:hypothetical protein